MAWVRFAPKAETDGRSVTSGRAIAKAGFENCSVTTKSGLMSLRQCLGSLHDSFIGELNTQYWKSLETGS